MKILFDFEIEGSIPTVNHYWSRARNGRLFITQKGIEFKERIKASAIKSHIVPSDKPISVEIYVAFKRKGRDIDNVLKPLLDAMQQVIYFNDNQIDQIKISRLTHIKKDFMRVLIFEL